MPSASSREEKYMSAVTPKPFNQKIRIWALRLVFLGCVPLILMSTSAWADTLVMHPLLKALGALLVIAAILYRFWAILYIGGRKNQMVMQDGPYSMCRHPLYFGTTLGALGFGLLLGSILLSVLLGALALIVLTATATREERFMRSEFGDGYAAYSAQVRNRILPTPANFKTDPEVTFVPRILRTNLADVLGFMAIFPVVEMLESLKSAGYLGSFVIY